VLRAAIDATLVGQVSLVMVVGEAIRECIDPSWRCAEGGNGRGRVAVPEGGSNQHRNSSSFDAFVLGSEPGLMTATSVPLGATWCLSVRGKALRIVAAFASDQ